MSVPIATPVYSLAEGAWEGNVEDDEGVAWVVTAEEGWSSSAPVRPRAEDREASHGAWGGPGYYSARVITLTGTAVAPSRTAMLRAKDRIRFLTPDADPVVLRVDEAHMSRQAAVRLGADVKTTDRGAIGFDFSLTLLAVDPRRYGVVALSATATLPTETAPGRTYPRLYPSGYGGATGGGAAVEVLNAGTFATGAVLRFYGPVNQPGVEEETTGARLRYDVLLATDADMLEVDLARRTALLGGTASRRSRLLAGSAWFLLPPGPTRLRMLGVRASSDAADPDPRMDVEWRSAWN